jgi:hypothetical protein
VERPANVNRYQIDQALAQLLNHNMSVEELELVVSGLAANELAVFAQWFDEFRAEQWDRQIEADILAGKLEAAGQRADNYFESGHRLGQN